MSCDEGDIRIMNVVFFFVVFQADTSKCDNKKTKNQAWGERGNIAPFLFFSNVVVAKKSPIVAPKHAVMKFLEIKSPQFLTCI